MVAAGDTWKYLDDGSDQGTAWSGINFNDTAWKSGSAQLGYGDGDEATVVSYGSDASRRYMTTYFRKAFTIDNPAAYSALAMQLIRDDGAVIYLNGVEILRSNMPDGAINYQTNASTDVTGTNETKWYKATINSALLRQGTNVLTVEIHQKSRSSSDVSFDLELKGTVVAGTMGTTALFSQNRISGTAATSDDKDKSESTVQSIEAMIASKK